MKAIFWLGLGFMLLLAVVAPVLYLVAAADLPALESEFDLERQLRGSIEGDRIANQAGVVRPRTDVSFRRPELGNLPREIVGFYISQWRCPMFLQTPREEDGAFAWRMISAQLLGRQPTGDGACERAFALQIAKALQTEGQMQRAVAAHRVRRILGKDQLLAYALATHRFDKDVVGLEDASWAVYRKELNHLRLEQYAELALTLPPHGYFNELRYCRNASLIRQARDYLLGELAREGLLTEEQAKSAQRQPVACTQT